MSERPDTGSEPTGVRRAARAGVQLGGFALGLGVLALIVRKALANDETRAQLARLGEAPWWILGVVIALGLASIVANGLIFWILVRPARRLPATELIAVNAIATGLSYLPFKLSVVFRVLVHRRRDGIALLTIGGWFAAVGASAVPMLIPIGMILLLGDGRDGVLGFGGAGTWWGLSVVLVIVSFLLITRLSAYFSTGPGWAWVRRLVERVLGERGARLANSEAAEQLRVGAALMAHNGTMGASFGLRVVDMVVQAVRFLVIASLMGVDLSPERSLVAACAYFLVGSAAPTGAAGIREGATLAAFGFDESMTSLVLAVSAADLGASLLGTGAGLAWLRPDRLLAKRDDDDGPSRDAPSLV